MMDYGMSDAEERQVWGYDDDDEDVEFDEYDAADQQIKEMKEEGRWIFQRHHI
jgi:hypothetical protein